MVDESFSQLFKLVEWRRINMNASSNDRFDQNWIFRENYRFLQDHKHGEVSDWIMIGFQS